MAHRKGWLPKPQRPPGSFKALIKESRVASDLVDVGPLPGLLGSELLGAFRMHVPHFRGPRGLDERDRRANLILK